MDLKSILILCFITTCCYAGQQNILINNLAITLVPGTPRPTLIYKPLSTLVDYKQVWDITTDGYIYSTAPGYTQYVWDIKQKLTTANTPVILYTLSSPAATNQKWVFNPTTGTIKSQLGTNYYVGGPNGINTVNMTYGFPATFQIKNPVMKPWICQSIGDPHISAYSTGRNDLFTPGSQQPGTYTLSSTGVESDLDYLLIQADQQTCYPDSSVYCNKRVILKTQGKLVEINCEEVIVNGVTVTNNFISSQYDAGNGVFITRDSRGTYTVDYPNGNTRAQCFDIYNKNVNIYVTMSSGDIPTGGVCTNYAGGVTPSKRAIILNPYQFLYSWRAKNRSADLFTYNSDLAWRIANPLNFTTNNGNFSTTNATLQAAAINACAEIAPGSPLVAQCGGYMDTSPAAYYQACLDDVIGTKDASFGTHVVGAFAEKCSKYAKPIIINLPTSGPDSEASGPGLELLIPKQPTNFTISAKDVNGNQVTAGNDDFVVSSEGPAVLTFTQVNLGNGYYRVFYTPAVSGHYKIFVSLKNVNPIMDSPFAVQVEPDAPKYSIAGYIKNAINNDPIADATVSVNTTSAITDSNGRYEVVGLFAGVYEISASASGFYTGQSTVTIVGASIPAGTTGDLSLSPILNAGQFRAVLTWGSVPRDLDFHLQTPTCHVFYGNPSCGGASLDVDLTGGFGPETITVSTSPTGLYTFYVVNYSRETTLNVSGGRIQVYKNSGLVADIHVPTAPSSLTNWRAFTVDQTGTVTVVNQLY